MNAICPFLIVVLAMLASTLPARPASIETARTVQGSLIRSIKVEGNIEPGDAERLLEKVLDDYRYYGTPDNTIFLRSRGGDVEEAMKMGEVIRRLRLNTEAPHWTGKEALSLVASDNPENFLCASACFLVYAGGISRRGEYILLHRPYLPPNAAKKLSDADYESQQKEIVSKVGQYLRKMEVAQILIDRMMTTPSSDRSPITVEDALGNEPKLVGMVPSITEVLLARNDCGYIPNLPLPKGLPVSELVRREESNSACFDKLVKEIRVAAAERELAELMKVCSPLTAEDNSSMRKIEEKGKAARAVNPTAKVSEIFSEDEIAEGQRLMGKQFAYNLCRRRIYDRVRD